MFDFNSTNSSIENGRDPAQYLAVILYFSYGIAAVIFNTILIVSLAKASLLDHGGFLSLAHYASTDLFDGLLNMFYSPWSVLYQRQFIYAYLPGMVLMLGEVSRKVFMVFIAGTNIYAVKYPYAARSTMTIAWYRRALLCTWIVSVMFAMPFWATRSMYLNYTKYIWEAYPGMLKFKTDYGFIINLIPTIIILICYPTCFYILIKGNIRWKNSSETNYKNHHNGSFSRQIMTSRERALMYIFALNAIIFMIYWIPIYLFEFMNLTFKHYGIMKETFRGVLHCYSPVLYWTMNGNIRSAINSFVLCRPALRRDLYPKINTKADTV